MDLSAALPTSALGFATTVHAALLVLRKERSASAALPLVLLVSLAFASTPWLFQTPIGVGAGLLAHLVWFLACEARIAPDLNPMGVASSASSGVSRSAGPRSQEFQPVKVLLIRDETPTIRTFRMVRPPTFLFDAGQFLTIRVQIGGRPHVRCYSISSAPEAADYIEISVKRLGLVSSALFLTVEAGSTLMVKPPNGTFVYPASDNRPIVLLAGGVGITPLMSMLRHGVATDPSRRVTLLYSVKTEAEIAFKDELDALVAQYPHVRLAVTLTGVEPSRWRVGRIDSTMIRQEVGRPTEAVYVLCGPLEMIREGRKGLEGAGVPPSQIHAEVFQPAAASGARPLPVGLAPSKVGERDALTASGGEVSPLLVLTRSHQEVRVPAGQTLLEAAEGVGVAIPSICRAGVCGTCKTRLIKGDAKCSSATLDEGERNEGYVLPCVTWAAGDCSLDA
jgi:ferredoxin-NADP reductase